MCDIKMGRRDGLEAIREVTCCQCGTVWNYHPGHVHDCGEIQVDGKLALAGTRSILGVAVPSMAGRVGQKADA